MNLGKSLQQTMKDSSLTMDEFKMVRNRKGNRGTINGTLFGYFMLLKL